MSTTTDKPVSNVELAARAICNRLGFNPDAPASRHIPATAGRGIILLPPAIAVAPLWTFYAIEAEAALEVMGSI